MANEKKRILELFYILTKHCDQYINSVELSKKVQVSDRTIKSDIKDLEKFAHASGSHIVSKKGCGYKLIIDKHEIYDPVKEQLQYYFGMFGSIQAMKSTRVNDIVRRIICEENYVTLDDIADELYLTRSALREDNKEVRKFLEKFNLRLKHNYESGPLVVGNEYDRRLAMLCVFDNHYHEAMTFYKDFDYLEWFDFDESKRFDIRHIFLRHLRESSCHIRDDHAQRLSRYLCLMSNRYNRGYKVNFNEKEVNFVHSFTEYNVAKELMIELENKYDIRVNDEEICGFAIQLLSWRDISAECDLEKNYSKLLTECEELVSNFCTNISNNFFIDLLKISGSYNTLMRLMIPLVIQQRFGLLNQLIRNVTVEDERIIFSPVASYFAFELDEVFFNKYHQHISLYNIATFACSLQSLILQIPYPFKPIRAIVCMAEGLNSAEMVRKIINLRYKGCFSRLDVYELYEMRGLNQDDYDYTILNVPSFSYKYDWPYLMVDQMPTQHQLNQVYNEIILSGVQLSGILNKLFTDKIEVYRNFSMADYEYFIDLISFRHGKNSECIGIIKQELLKRGRAFIHNKVMVLMIKRKYTDRNFIEFYELSNEHVYKDCAFDYIVVLSADFSKNISGLRFINDLMFMMFQDTKHIKKIMRSSQIDSLIDIVKEALKSLPISLT
ncbi:MAG: HTH domain-containing protein [Erysipelotrichaceae bacterium]|nr:HTH domain-containing protein [Erysipelotrichaceae bacterium]MDY5252929.1 HTH domain-containing protein [Erysipelotrichaceae bacterium]